MDGDEFDTVEAHDAARIRADAVGEPGQRRFRIQVLIADETVIAWMEKEQVRRLGELLTDVVDRLPEPVAPADERLAIGDFDEATSRQFRAGRMELSYDDEDDRLVVIMYDIEGDDDQAAALACRLTRAQATDFAAQATEIVAKGRPPCPLCGQPMGPGPHVCEKQNGHFPKRLGGDET